METIKQKIEGQSTKNTEVAPVVQIVTEEEYIELFGTESDGETFDGDLSEIGVESTEETPESQCAEDDSRIRWNKRRYTEKQDKRSIAITEDM